MYKIERAILPEEGDPDGGFIARITLEEGFVDEIEADRWFNDILQAAGFFDDPPEGMPPAGPMAKALEEMRGSLLEALTDALQRTAQAFGHLPITGPPPYTADDAVRMKAEEALRKIEAPAAEPVEGPDDHRCMPREGIDGEDLKQGADVIIAPPPEGDPAPAEKEIRRYANAWEGTAEDAFIVGHLNLGCAVLKRAFFAAFPDTKRSPGAVSTRYYWHFKNGTHLKPAPEQPPAAAPPLKETIDAVVPEREEGVFVIDDEQRAREAAIRNAARRFPVGCRVKIVGLQNGKRGKVLENGDVNLLIEIDGSRARMKIAPSHLIRLKEGEE